MPFAISTVTAAAASTGVPAAEIRSDGEALRQRPLKDPCPFPCGIRRNHDPCPGGIRAEQLRPERSSIRGSQQGEIFFLPAAEGVFLYHFGRGFMLDFNGQNCFPNSFRVRLFVAFLIDFRDLFGMRFRVGVVIHLVHLPHKGAEITELRVRQCGDRRPCITSGDPCRKYGEGVLPLHRCGAVV